MKETNKNINKKFIHTSDEDMREKLLSLGFTEITESGTNGYCFINNGRLTFENDDIKDKIAYTNILCL